MKLTESHKKTAEYILSIQLNNGAIPWSKHGKLDPWDHTEAAMGLSVAGHYQQAEQAYFWLLNNQREDGSWHSNYTYESNYEGYTEDSDLRETNFIAYIATGVWHHYLITQDSAFLKKMYPCVNAALSFVITHQNQHGDIAWAVDASGNSKDDALITACSSILRSIECTHKICKILKKPTHKWKQSANILQNCLTCNPQRFDRTWESKARFSMDWYYPILAGMYTAINAKTILEKRWQEFVVDDLGCRCVNDEPWVTMAETCELVIALIASKQNKKASALFKTLDQWCDKDGGYWTGYVFRDKTIWPEEKTTWTAGAVLLAADALYAITPAANLFTLPLHLE